MIPRAISETLVEQELSALYEIRDLVNRLILEKEPSPRDREVVEVKRSGSITYRLERVYCGKNCGGCPHGPYWYGYWKEDGKTRSKYVGKSMGGDGDRQDNLKR